MDYYLPFVYSLQRFYYLTLDDILIAKDSIFNILSNYIPTIYNNN